MRAERRRGADAAEQRAHRAVPQHVHVIDAVRARRHARDQGRTFRRAFTPQSPAGRTCSATSSPRPGALREGHHRDEPGVRHQMRVIERRDGLRQGVQQSHLRGVLSNRVMEASDTPILPAQRAPFTLTRRNAPLFERWIEAKSQRCPSSLLRGRLGSIATSDKSPTRQAPPVDARNHRGPLNPNLPGRAPGPVPHPGRQAKVAARDETPASTAQGPAARPRRHPGRPGRDGSRPDGLLADRGAVDLGEVRADLPGRQPLRIQGQDDLVDPGSAAAAASLRSAARTSRPDPAAPRSRPARRPRSAPSSAGTRCGRCPPRCPRGCSFRGPGARSAPSPGRPRSRP